MTNSLPWKITIFKNGKPRVNDLFRLGPSIPWRTVSHNQRVYHEQLSDGDLGLLMGLGDGEHKEWEQARDRTNGINLGLVGSV